MNKKSLLSAFLSLLLLSMLTLTFWSAMSVQADPSWDFQTVDNNAAGQGNGYSPVAVDSNNMPHIAYTGSIYDSDNRAGGFTVMYASWNGSSWNTQEIGLGNAFSLVLDANDNPHILHEAGGLKIASLTGSNWAIQTVDKQGAGYGVIALDSSGHPHVAYINGKELKYASITGSNWNIQTIETSSEIYGLSLALDANNTQYVLYSIPSSYVDNSTGISYRSIIVKLAIHQDLRWNIQTVLASSNLADHGNIVLDSKGYPHFICTEGHFISATNTTFVSTLLYASWTGSAWTTQKVVSNTRLLENWPIRSIGFLALDSHDYPHISYVALPSPEKQSVQYASWTGTDWKIQTVDTNITAKEPGYIAVDSNGNPHISYRGIGPDQSSIGSIATIMYATANVTEFTQPPSPTFPALPLLLVSTAVIIGAVVTVVYVWKKKTKH